MKQKIVLIVSIAVGILAAVLTRTYLASKDAEMQKLKEEFMKRHKTIDVLCFAREVSRDMKLAKSDLGVKTVPASGLRGQALTEENLMQVLDRKVLNSHKTGDILFWSDIEGGNPAAGGLAADIRKKMRAVSINCTGAAAVSGMVKPNDRVDVIASFSFPTNIASFSFPTNIANSSSLTNVVVVEARPMIVQELVTCTILQNVLVLATGKETAKSALARSDAFGAGTYSTVTLEVTPREAEMLVFAEQIKGRISLALRNKFDTYYENELPQVNFEKIRGEIEDLNKKRQSEVNGGY